MAKGFFSPSQFKSISIFTSRVPKCGLCKLFQTCKSPKMPPSGKGKKRVLILAEAPGETEDEHGIQLIGKSGQLLIKVLRKLGIDMRNDCWLTNSVICRPPSNETPTEKQLAYCRPNLLNTIDALKPDIIIPLGGTAIKSLLGPLWKEDVGATTRWVGWNIPMQKPNCWVCPTYHPSYLIRLKDPTLDMLFARHLEAAFKLEGKPWKEIPNYEVECIYPPSHAVKAIREIVAMKKPIAFDYETNRLKPDHKEARIVCCSISNGERTIAYPWHGEAISASLEMVRSPLPKIASNIKFEERWTKAQLKTRVRNWWWDTMLAAHWMDNRAGITSIKFQAFVLLGTPSYDDSIKAFLKGKGASANSENRIKEAYLGDLLKYCGMDSLVEYQVAMKQRELMGVENE